MTVRDNPPALADPASPAARRRSGGLPDRSTRPEDRPTGVLGRWHAERSALLVLLGAYLLSLLLVHPGGEFALIDDWAHAMAVRDLLHTGHLHLPDWSPMTLIAQIGWGAAFAQLFGFSFTVLRVSTLILGYLASVGLYALCRELNLPRRRAVAGALTLWFNPITFSLSYTFMTDVPYLAMFILATLFSIRGTQRESTRDLALGSLFAGLAFLIRQPGILLPLAVLTHLTLTRPPLPTLLRRAGATTGPAATLTAGYWLWARTHRPTSPEQNHLTILREHHTDLIQPTLILGGYLLVYLGLFFLPLAVGLVGGAVRAARATLARGWGGLRRPAGWVTGTAVGGVAALVVYFAGQGGSVHTEGGLAMYDHGGWMPYLKDSSLLTLPGIGPNDLRGTRAVFFTTPMVVALTLLCAAALVLLVAGLAGAGTQSLPAAVHAHDHGRRRWGGGPIGLLLLIGALQAGAMLALSARVAVVTPPQISFDRYLLPLAPLAIALGLHTTRQWRLSWPPTVAGLAVAALFSVAGTQDWLSYNRLRWTMTRELTRQGVPAERIDAGMEPDAWCCYHRPAGRPRTPDGPWWTTRITPTIDSSYVVAFSPQPGYRTVARREYPSWLHRDPVYLYLLNR